ncbi:MAG: gamma-glutamyltransferase family protein [Burkholderiaceae bacterium]
MNPVRASASLLLVLASLLAGCASPRSDFSYTVPIQPEPASGYTEKPGWASKQFAVVAANPLAADAGYQVLKAGGSAVDAAIAVQMVLALVEPQATGLGGGAFLLHFDGKKVEAFDGRETAPAAVDDRLFLGADGKPMPFFDAVVGGRSVGVPGAVRMLEMVHQQYGKLPWASLFQPAITLAESGFKISPRLHSLLVEDAYLKHDPTARAYFYQADGTAHDVGTLLRNPALAEVLRQIAARGSRALLEGDVAQAIVDKVRTHPTNPGQLSMADLAGYRSIKREALCTDYRAHAHDFRICGFPPPNSGAIAIAQILGMLGDTNAAALPLQDGEPSADWLHLYTEAARLAFADRAQYVGDPAFVKPPTGGWMALVDPVYLAERAKLIGQGPDAKSMKSALPGTPHGSPLAYAPMPQQPEYGTSHMSIVDRYGNAVAMTTTIESAFGSRQMVRGFLLNNELTDFSFAPTDASGMPVANRVEPGKRPRSSMSPTLVFDKASGALIMAVGSSGGAQIIHDTAKTLYGVLQWGMLPQQAINLPNFGSFNGPTLLEKGRFPESTIEALKARGHDVREVTTTSGLHAFVRGQAHGSTLWLGGADPRREGVMMGD